MKMTLANKITFIRLMCIPVYILFLVLYGGSVAQNAVNVSLRWVATSLFLLIFVLDAVDGTIARLLNQTTVLGSILDPVADKALVISSLVTLILLPSKAFDISIPSWYAITVISRDGILITCSAILFRMIPAAAIKPRIIGKAATFFNATVIAIVLTGLMPKAMTLVTLLAVSCTVVSGIWYLIDGIRQTASLNGKAARL